ncbi:hypothetical protein TSUD_400330 [Trifolium subterraneum]|uniref:Uncharacterized protein n=1 Tax=Trifolium subterraneum TaxID=3900 RepID=A0A2Z6NK78_TRISU|nr:hypothetical protein TSUD_400330 [Trifolium subterraneum]
MKLLTKQVGKKLSMHEDNKYALYLDQLKHSLSTGTSIVAWLSEHDYKIKKIFVSKGSRHLSEMYMEARNKRERPSWIGEDAWKKLEDEWKKPEYKEISKRNKKNRASTKGGSVCTGGSISFTEHALRMVHFSFCIF